MTKTKNRFHLFAVASLVSALGACGTTEEQRLQYGAVEAQGSYGDGTALSFREAADQVVCTTGMPDESCRSILSLRLAANPTEALRGIRINYVPARMSAQTPYESGVLEPVTLSVVQARGDRYVDATVAGGEVKFDKIAAAAGEESRGTFRNMVFKRLIAEGVEQTILTLDSGTFRLVQP